MEITSLMDWVYKVGAVPLLVYWVYTLRGDVKILMGRLDKSQDDHKQDLKNYNEEMKVFVANIMDKIKT